MVDFFGFRDYVASSELNQNRSNRINGSRINNEFILNVDNGEGEFSESW